MAKHPVHSLVIYFVTICRKQSTLVFSQLVRSSGRALCNGVRASRSATELCGLSAGYHSSRNCFMSLLVFVQWLGTVTRSITEQPIIILLEKELYNLQKTTKKAPVSPFPWQQGSSKPGCLLSCLAHPSCFPRQAHQRSHQSLCLSSSALPTPWASGGTLRFSFDVQLLLIFSGTDK